VLALDSPGTKNRGQGENLGMSRIIRQASFVAGVCAVAGLVSFQLYGSAAAQPAPSSQVAANTPATAPTVTDASPLTTSDRKHMLMQYCTACHNDKLRRLGKRSCAG